MLELVTKDWGSIGVLQVSSLIAAGLFAFGAPGHCLAGQRESALPSWGRIRKTGRREWMMHEYLTFADGTMVLHSDLKEDDNGGRVLVHFERPTEDGFDSVRFELPSYEMKIWEGSFTQDELSFFRTFLENNAHLLYEYAATGGLRVA